MAALIVVVSHYSNASGIWGATLGDGAGQLGVMIFFVLSGFLMSFLYGGRPFGRRELRAYAVARFARVVPLFVAVVLASHISLRIAPNDVAYPVGRPGRLLSHLLFLRGVSILWTIPVEVQFYLLFAVVWLAGDRFKHGLWLACAFLIGASVLWGYPHWGGAFRSFNAKVLLIQSLPYFCVGVIFGRLYLQGTFSRWRSSPRYLLTLLAIPLLYPSIFMALFGEAHANWRDLRVLAVVTGVAFVYIFLVPESRLVANAMGDHIGKISYSLYVVHLPLLALMEPVIEGGKYDPFLLMLAFVSLSIGVSTLTYQLVEAPSRRYLRATLMPSG